MTFPEIVNTIFSFMSPMELVAVVFSLICVVLTLKNNIWCWPTGLVGVVAYTYVFYGAKLYSDVILQLFYIIMQFVGWYEWLHGGAKKDKLLITNLTNKEKALWTGGILAATILWGAFMTRFTNASLPYPDAFTTVGGISAQWLLCVKKLQAWILWVILDISCIIIYLIKDLNITAGLYAVFLVLATMGYFKWKKLQHDESVLWENL